MFPGGDTQGGWDSSSELRQQGAGFTGTVCQGTEDKTHRGGHQVGKGVRQGKAPHTEVKVTVSADQTQDSPPPQSRFCVQDPTTVVWMEF